MNDTNTLPKPGDRVVTKVPNQNGVHSGTVNRIDRKLTEHGADIVWVTLDGEGETMPFASRYVTVVDGTKATFSEIARAQAEKESAEHDYEFPYTRDEIEAQCKAAFVVGALWAEEYLRGR